MEIIDGKIIGYNEHTHELTIVANYDNFSRLCLREYSEVQVGLPDGRNMSDAQRRKVMALIREIADYSGYRGRKEMVEYIYHDMRSKFVTMMVQSLKQQTFHMSNGPQKADMTTASEFIDFIVEFMLEWGIPSSFPLYSKCESVQRYVYACFINRRCAVCNHVADLHHVDRVGMGRNRDDICQIGMDAIPLCRQHHQQAHRMGDKRFLERYHLEPLQLTETNIEQARKKGLYGFNSKSLGGRDDETHASA